MFIVTFFAIALSSCKEKMAESFIRLVKHTTWVMTIGFGLFVLFYKIIEAISIV
ncbi:hypothetical protein CCP4SC76_6040003 [Gammaproteobacteria bacterium]